MESVLQGHSDFVALAMHFATEAHGAQMRKYGGGRYIEHPISVMNRLPSNATDATKAAALLHDVVEDCGVTIETIEAKFGPEVAKLVGELTDVSKPSEGNRKVRKALDLRHTAEASRDAQTIKVCDLIDNSLSIIEAAKENKEAEAFLKVYMAEKKALLAVLGRADSLCHGVAQSIVDYYYATVAS